MEDSDNESNISADSLQYETGAVTEKEVAKGLTNRGYSASGTELVYLDLCLVKKNLTNISLLENYQFLQHLDVSNNKLSNIDVISKLKYLLSLNASNNLLTSLPPLSSPLNLLSADFSHNHIANLSHAGRVMSLLNLNLDHNEISNIYGLDGCSSLKQLSLNNNKISEITNLDQLSLHVLHLNNNKISKISGLEEFGKLQTLHLANNNIRSLRGLQGKMVLSELRLEGNDIIDLLEIRQLQNLPLLRRLTLMSNPLTSLPDYRSHLLFYLNHLSHLDEIKILPEEKIAALNQFDPPLEVIAAQNHTMHIVKNLVHPIHIKPSVMSDMNSVYPILVLTGPNGSGKYKLAQKLVKSTSNAFRLIKLFTTKKVPDDRNVISVTQEEFDGLIDEGKLIVSYEVGGAMYGLNGQDLEIAAHDGVASVICMELEGVLSLKRTTYQARIVLISPMDSVKHEARMRERARYTEPLISLSLKRTEMYNKYHADNQGVCDLAINSSDLDQGFEKLKQLVEYYSGHRSGVGPGQGEIIKSAPELGLRQWSRGSSSTFDNQHNFPRKEAIVKSAVKGVTHPVTPDRRGQSRSSTSYVYPDTGELSMLSNTEYSSSTELTATAHSLVQLKNITIPPLTHRTM
ncbi:hypothetical protein ACHWQZ_G016083 [Mnemiopsis leidyi]